MTPGKIRIGISGWRYKGWRGVFYPEKLPQRRELEFASRKFDTIELNGSFYSLQRPQSFLQWRAETPRDFTFAIKGSRYITHMLRLRNVEGPLANFFAQGLLHLGASLGPILWQLPPNFPFEPERLEQFFTLLPRTMKQAAELAGTTMTVSKTVPGFKCEKMHPYVTRLRFATKASSRKNSSGCFDAMAWPWSWQTRSNGRCSWM